jgi:hypothetical protein
MRMIISMKKINCNGWAPHNHYLWDAPIPITNLPILTNSDILYYSFYVYNAGGPAKFYDRLAGNVYNILDEDNYFYEDD